MGLSRQRQCLLLLLLFTVVSLTYLLVSIYTSQQTSLARSPENLDSVFNSKNLAWPPESPDSVASSRRHNMSSRGKGYMLAFHYWEQQTQALHNVFQLQCVADSFGMKIVEPFVVNSMFGFPFEHLSKEPPEPHLKVSDLINMDQWNNNITSLFGYSPVSNWDTFLQEAPRQLIISCIRYRNPWELKVPEQGYNFQNGCPKKCFDEFDSSLQFLSGHGFKLVRKSCSNFVDYGETVWLSGFKHNILGDYHPGDVTVLINEFRGLYGLYRLPLQSDCGLYESRFGKVSVLPSSRILNQAQKYTDDVFKGEPYVSVIARIERLTLHLHHDISKCAEEVKHILMKLKSTRGTKEVFLSMDVGKFGSNGASKLQSHGELLFQTVYSEGGWTFEEWEKSFADIVTSGNAAYVANLQRTITARGECLIMLGGGGFQGQALSLYEKFHTNKAHQCVYYVCTSHNQV